MPPLAARAALRTTTTVASTVASTAAAAAALRTIRVDDLRERGGLRSQWLRHAELTGGVRGRDARLEQSGPIWYQVDAVSHEQQQLRAL